MRSRDRQDETDEQPTYAPLWVSEPRREDETNRLQQAVIEAAQRLRRGFAEPSYEISLQPQQPTGMSFRQVHTLSSLDLNQHDASPDRYPPNDLEETSRRIWAGLTPKFVAPPPLETISLPSVRTTTGVVGAVVAAAGIAWVIVNVMQLPISMWGANEDDVRNVQFSSIAAPGSPTTISEVGTIMQALDAPSAPAGTSLAAAPTNKSAASNLFAPFALPPAASIPAASTAAAPTPAALPSAPQSSQEVELARPEMAKPKAAAAPEALTPDETAALLRRAQDLIAAGDIASARLILTHLAEAGDADASFILAGTLDPAVLATRRVVGVLGDPERARTWYARAAEQGSSEARRYLDQSALR